MCTNPVGKINSNKKKMCTNHVSKINIGKKRMVTNPVSNTSIATRRECEIPVNKTRRAATRRVCPESAKQTQQQDVCVPNQQNKHSNKQKFRALHWNIADAEINWSLLLKNSELPKVVSFKPGVGQNTILHASPASTNYLYF